MAKAKPIKDHKGKTYSSFAKMCKAYGKNSLTVASRLESGMGIEQAITKPVKKINKVKDHRGKEYSSFAEMCRAYGKGYTVVKHRLQKGWNLEKALEHPVRSVSKKCVDHNGIGYSSFREMCKAHNKDNELVRARLKHGMSMQDALTLPVKEISEKCVDHNGNEYKSFMSMCKAYGKSSKAVRRRLDAGISLEEALTADRLDIKENTRRKKWVDHNGNEYNSINDMCSAYGIKRSTFLNRLRNGMDLNEALTTPNIRGSAPKNCDGVEYKSFASMCKEHGIEPSTVSRRLKAGMELEEALKKPVEKRDKIEFISHDGTEYRSFSEMCSAYGKNYRNVLDRMDRGVEMDVALISDRKLNLEFIGLDGRAYYKVYGIDGLMTTRELIEYFKPELLERYDSMNPSQLYRPNNTEGD